MIKKIFFVFFVFLFQAGVFGATITSTVVAGNWSAPSTWSSITRTGTISSSTSSTTITGVGTQFTSQFVAGSMIYRNDGTTLIGVVASISNNTTLQLVANAAVAVSSQTYTAKIVPTAADDVVIPAGNTVVLNTTPVTVNSITISGTLSLPFNSVSTVNSSLIVVTAPSGNISFDKSEIRLPSNVALYLQNGSNSLGGSCNNNDEIFVGSTQYAVCTGGGAPYLFSEIETSGGVNIVTTGTIGTSQTICSGAIPSTLTSTTAGTGSGTISYEWQTNASGSYVTISGATNSTYSPPALTATTSYQRRTVSVNGIYTFYSAYTTPVTITVSPSVGGTVSGATSVCTGTNSTVLTLSGHTGTVTRWESSLNNFATAGTTIANTTTTLTATNLTVTTSYRAVVTRSGCASANSASATVTVNASPTISALTTPTALCSASSWNPTAPTVTSNGAAVTAQGWQLETAFGSGSYVSLPVPYTALLADTGKRVRYFATNSCGTTNSNAVTLTVNSTPNAPTIASIIQPICTLPTGTVSLSSLPAGAWELTRSPGAVKTLGSGTTATVSGLASGTYTFSVVNKGLKGEYFSGNRTLSGAPTFTRIDSTIDFSLNTTQSPNPSMPTFNRDQYSARWTGFVEPLYSQTYTFKTISNDGIRLWVNGVQIIDNWTTHANTIDTGTIALTAGVKYSIVLEYYQDNQSITARLFWSSASQSEVIIPASALSPDTGCSSPESANAVINPTLKIWNGTTWTPTGAPTEHQDIQFTAIYAQAADINACSCTVNSGAVVTILAGNYLKLGGLLTVNAAGTLTFENNASLIQTGFTGTNVGNIIYKRNYTGGETDYTYWSSPVAAQNLLALSPSTKLDKFFSFDDIAENWLQLDASTTTMTPAKGYIIRGIPPPGFPAIPPGFGTATFTGMPNNGSIPITVSSGIKSNLIGNPYPSAISADQFIFDNQTAIEGTIYFWTHNTPIAIGTPDPGTGGWAYSGNDYAAYSLTGGVGTGSGTFATSGGTRPTGFIAAGQSFFTTSTASGGTVTFTNTMRVDGSGNPLSNSNFYKTKSPKNKAVGTIEKNRIWLNLTNKEGAFKQTLVGYITGATNTWDALYDGESFDGNDFLDFYSINEDTNLTIQGRALPFDENDIIPLGYRIAMEGTFTIKINETDGLLSNRDVFLEDKLTNTVFNLKSGKYVFTTAAGTFNDRFVLRFTDKTLRVDDNVEENNGIIALYSNSNQSLIIRNNLKDVAVDSVTLFNLVGQKVANWNVEDKEQSNILIPIKKVSSEIYIVKIKTTEGEFSKKIIIK
ncbi:PA14 domain-containing protein [Flavobacterium sp.]|uniref:PA14 domain-containing protein n=1 Tax=Flavobacterium sp. TaxID=239 RepID=UPI00286DC971|nr:PA14 domain-containing protein [Flavobacterium sp.]